MTLTTLNFAGQLCQNYRAGPEAVALRLLYSRQPEQTLSWDDLLRGAVAYAQALDAAGIQAGEVVILILQHGAPLVQAFLGAALHGAAPAMMPFLTEKLSPEQYRQSLAALFQVSAPAAVITYAEFQPEVAAAIQQGPQPSPVRTVLLESEVPPLAQLNAADLDSLAGLQRPPEAIALLQHSSGTTGLQKGVALSYRAIANQLDSYAAALALNANDVIVSWLPLYHDMGLIAGFLLPLLRRLPLVLMSPLDWVRAPYRLFQAVSQYGGTLTWLPNFAYNFCAQKILDRHLEGVDLSSWRAVINCSEPMSAKSHALFLQRFAPYGLRPQALATCYAMAENVFAVSQGGIHDPVKTDRIGAKAYFQARQALPAGAESDEVLQIVSAGRPIANTRVRILSAALENGENNQGPRQELPERQIGEIAIQSDCMLNEYYRRPDATAQAFYEGWYLTGDLGYLAEGEVYIAGRKKDLIIVGGKNVYPQDLEQLAGEVTGVYPGRVAAFGVFNDEAGTEEVVLLAEVDEAAAGLANSDDPDARAAALESIADEIRRQVTRRSDVALRHVHLVARGWLLKTSSGKVARSANREKYLQMLKSV